jgi:hypothetical protein
LSTVFEAAAPLSFLFFSCSSKFCPFRPLANAFPLVFFSFADLVLAGRLFDFTEVFFFVLPLVELLELTEL